ncbi:MAG: presenilin family intramembrane aspartyl protease [Patescibacteria group bacterium]
MIFLFIQELILFALAQLIGIFVALKSRTLIQGQNITIDFTAGEIIIFLILFVAFIYFLSRFSHKSKIFFRLVLGLVVFIGSQTVFSLFFGEVIVSTIIAIGLAVLVLKAKIILLHNIGMILALAGIGAVLGLSLTPISVVFLLLILSFYDIIAVYKTGHMVKIAEEMIKARAISGIVLPQTIKDWFGSLENVQPGGRFMILGSGDVVMPLILVASVIGFYGLSRGLVVMLFSMFGLFLTFYLFITQKTRRPMAALPPIAAMSIIGYLVSIVL